MQKVYVIFAVMACILLIPGCVNIQTDRDIKGISQDCFCIIANSDEDQTDKIQNYLDAIGRQGGGEAHLCAGAYMVKGSLTIPAGVSLEGSWSAPHTGLLTKGTVIKAYGYRGSEDGPALFKMQENTAIKGLTIVYPEQKLTDIQAYPWTIQGEGMHNTIENLTLVNSYQGIQIGPEVNSLHLIRNVFGCVLRRGILIDYCADIGRIENVHFNPHYWVRSGHDGVPGYDNQQGLNPDIEVAKYMQEHLEAFIFVRTDWEYVFNTFVFGAKVGYRFTYDQSKGVAWACNGQFLGIGADMCRYGVLVEQTQPWGILITNGQFVGGPLSTGGSIDDIIAIYTKPTFNGIVQLTNCSMWGRFENILRLEGKGFVSVSQASFKCWQPEKPVVDIVGGRAVIDKSLFDSFFVDATDSTRYDNMAPHIKIGEDVNRVNVTDNFCLYPGGLKIENHAGDRLIEKNNE